MTGDKDSRNKVIEVSRFVKENVKREDIKKAFQTLGYESDYGDISTKNGIKTLSLVVKEVK